jgi:hypothetical protein
MLYYTWGKLSGKALQNGERLTLELTGGADNSATVNFTMKIKLTRAPVEWVISLRSLDS